MNWRRIGYCQVYSSYFGKGNLIEQKDEACHRLDCTHRSKYSFLLQIHVENLEKLSNDNILVSAVVDTAVQALPRNELSPLPWCLNS